MRKVPRPTAANDAPSCLSVGMEYALSSIGFANKGVCLSLIVDRTDQTQGYGGTVSF